MNVPRLVQGRHLVQVPRLVPRKLAVKGLHLMPVRRLPQGMERGLRLVLVPFLRHLADRLPSEQLLAQAAWRLVKTPVETQVHARSALPDQVLRQRPP